MLSEDYIEDKFLRALEKTTRIKLFVICKDSALGHFGLSNVELTNIQSELRLEKQLSQDLLFIDVLKLIKEKYQLT